MFRSSRPMSRAGRFVLACSLLLLAACGGGSGAPDAGPSDALTLRVGDQGKVLQLPLELSGEDKGVPYKLELDNFADGPHVNAAFIADALDVAFLGDTPLLMARAARIDLVVIAAGRVTPNSAVRLVARPGSGIRTLADLKGKRVAFTKGTGLQGFVLLALDTVRLGQKDVTVVDVPNVSLASTLQSGSADAAVLSGPQLAGYVLDHPDAVQLDVPIVMYNALVARRQALADPAKAAAIRDLVGRLVKADRWKSAHRDAWLDKYYRDALHQPPRIADYLENHTPSGVGFGPVGDDLARSLRAQARVLTAAGALPEGVDLVGPLFDPGINADFNKVVAEASS